MSRNDSFRITDLVDASVDDATTLASASAPSFTFASTFVPTLAPTFAPALVLTLILGLAFAFDFALAFALDVFAFVRRGGGGDNGLIGTTMLDLLSWWRDPAIIII